MMPIKAASAAQGTIGEWRLLRELGRWSSGQVWLARKGDSEPAALKVFARSNPGVDEKEWGARFEREGRLLARIAHLNVVRVLETGRAPETGRGWLATEFLAGLPLDEILAEQRLERIEIAWGLAALARGLSAVHEAGIGTSSPPTSSGPTTGLSLPRGDPS